MVIFNNINNILLLIYNFRYFNGNLEYHNIFKFLCLILLINLILLLIPYLINGRNIKHVEKTSEYECGFEPFDSAIQHPFTIHFYIIGILFLVFDVEIVLLFP